MTSAPPTVLSVCNRYRERGGEEEVFEAEAELLERHGWRVVRVTERVGEPVGVGDRLRLARDAVWSPGWHDRITRLLAAERPDLVHLHNTFPVISPSVVAACRRAGVPVVKTLHNYRLLCAAATLWRDGRPCRDCIGRAPWPALVHRCYQGSLARTGVVAGSMAVHRALGTWSRGVEVFLAPTEFVRRIFIEAGLPADKLVVKPNFVDPDPAFEQGPERGTETGDAGDYALFAGRLSEGKGVGDLLAAWSGLEVPLRIYGAGPLAADVEAFARRRPGVEYLGRRDRSEVLAAMRGARFVVFPSRWYECGPLVVLEALACGVPVVAADGGAAAEMLEGGVLGWLYQAGDPAALAAAAGAAWRDPAGARERGRRGRCAFERSYTAAESYRRLSEVYRGVLGRSATGAAPTAGRRAT